MSPFRIFFGNIGYGRGIDGKLASHLLYAHRHIYCRRPVQVAVMRQVSSLIEAFDPDICCFVEIDAGSVISAQFDQMAALANDTYRHYSVENKYGLKSWLRNFSVTKAKSNAFLSRHDFPHEKIYLDAGAKRLVYKVQLRDGVTLFFAHFSLSLKVRRRQLAQVQRIIRETEGEVILMGDFNILTGFGELEPMLEDGSLVLMNNRELPTFRFHKQHSVLDLCLCSPSLAERSRLVVIPQPYSDHAALLLEVNPL